MHGNVSSLRRRSVDDHADALAIISAISRIHDVSTTIEDMASAAAMLGRPAYLSWSSHTNAAAISLCETANSDGLAAAIAVHCDDAYPSGAKHRPTLLATLIPINKAAIAELAEARAEMAHDLCDAVRAHAKARRAA